MRSVTSIIGLICFVLFAGCTTTYQLTTPETGGRSLDFYTPQELSTLSAAVKKLAGTNSTQQIDSNNIVRIVDGSVVNQFIIPDELKRDAVSYSGQHSNYDDVLDVYTLYGRFRYQNVEGTATYDYRRSSLSEDYKSSDLPNFVDYLCASRAKAAQDLFVKSRQEYPWLNLIEGDYISNFYYNSTHVKRGLRIIIQEDCCYIFSLENGEKKVYQGGVLSFFGAGSSDTIKVVSFASTGPVFIHSVVDRLGSPILTNGFSNIQFRTISFKDDYSTLVLDGEEYRDGGKYEVFLKKKRAVEAAEKVRNEKMAREADLKREARIDAEIEQLRQIAPDLIKRCEGEAREKDALCIKGLYLGMKMEDATKLCRFYGHPSEKFTIRADRGVVTAIFLMRARSVDEMFGTSGLTAIEFVREFMRHYNIPSMDGLRGGWEYRDIDRGVSVEIFDDKTIILKAIPTRSALKFDD